MSPSRKCYDGTFILDAGGNKVPTPSELKIHIPRHRILRPGELEIPEITIWDSTNGYDSSVERLIEYEEALKIVENAFLNLVILNVKIFKLVFFSIVFLLF